MKRARRITAAQRRQRSEARKGWLMVALSAVIMATMVTGAYQVDKARGVTAGQSLNDWGL